MDLYAAVSKIDELVDGKFIADKEQSLKELIKNEIKTKNTVDNRLINEVEHLIKSYISDLDNDDVIGIWEQTDMGLISKDAGDNYIADPHSARFDVEVEVLSEYTNYLWEQFGDKDKRQSTRSSAFGGGVFEDFEDFDDQRYDDGDDDDEDAYGFGDNEYEDGYDDDDLLY